MLCKNNNWGTVELKLGAQAYVYTTPKDGLVNGSYCPHCGYLNNIYPHTCFSSLHRITVIPPQLTIKRKHAATGMSKHCRQAGCYNDYTRLLQWLRQEKLKKREPVYYMREHVKELPAAEKKVVAKRNSGSFTNVREEPDWAVCRPRARWPTFPSSYLGVSSFLDLNVPLTV